MAPAEASAVAALLVLRASPTRPRDCGACLPRVAAHTARSRRSRPSRDIRASSAPGRSGLPPDPTREIPTIPHITPARPFSGLTRSNSPCYSLQTRKIAFAWPLHYAIILSRRRWCQGPGGRSADSYPNRQFCQRFGVQIVASSMAAAIRLPHRTLSETPRSSG